MKSASFMADNGLPEIGQSGSIEWTASFALSDKNDYASVLSGFIKQLHFPIMTDERKRQLLATYQKWGCYGWTPDPCEKMYQLFKTIPVDKSDADKKARKLFRDMSPVFNKIRGAQRVKKTDFDEAVVSFGCRRYKSCALILFSLIDAQLIRLQENRHNTNKRRCVGSSAVKNAREQSGFDGHDEWLLLALYYNNVFSCLSTMFADGKDFKIQPEVINRNFLSHGMMWRKVTRTHCIQLFLLYYNVLEMRDLIVIRSNNDNENVLRKM